MCCKESHRCDSLLHVLIGSRRVRMQGHGEQGKCEVEQLHIAGRTSASMGGDMISRALLDAIEKSCLCNGTHNANCTVFSVYLIAFEVCANIVRAQSRSYAL